MKSKVRNLMLLAFLLLTSSAMWADGEVRIIQTGQGEVTAAIEGNVCTLTATPAFGYSITAEQIAVVKTLLGDEAKVPNRSPNIAEPIAITATDPDADPSGVTTYTFEMPASPYDVEVTAAFQKMEVKLVVNGIIVTDYNKMDILKDGGSVQLSGKDLLVLTNAEFYAGGIQSWLDNLTIYLNKESKIEVENSPAIEVHGGRLKFTTEGNEPGKLSMKTTSQQGVVIGFDGVDYEQNLTLLSGSLDGQEAFIGTPVKPITDETGEENVVNVGENDPDADYSNTVVDNVLYTLDKANNDGIDPNDNCVILGSTMIEDDVQGVIDSYTPGTPEFAENFAGLTFMVPAGYGKIYVNARTGSAGVLNVKIGSGNPFVLTGAIEFKTFTIPYACSEATYVLIYSNSPVQGAESVGNRAGKKTTVTIGVGSVGVTSNVVQNSNGDSGGDGEIVVLSDDGVTYDAENGTLVATDATVNYIADDAFITFPFLKFIDLSNTSITGLKVSRSEGPFKGVSKNTFIYLPAGNSSDEPNVVIGSVSENVVLDGQMKVEDEESFGLSHSFMAQQVAFDYPFETGKMTAICLPFDIDMDAAQLYGTFYLYDGIQDGNVTLTPYDMDIEAHTPYMFKPASDAQMTAAGVMMAMPGDVDGTPRREAAAMIDDFYGTYEFMSYDPTNRDVFRLEIKDNNVPTFQRLKEGESIRPFECYLYAFGQTADSFGAQGEGVPTSVRAIRTVSPSLSDSWSALSGQVLRSMPTEKGVYIHQGRKVVIR